MQHRRANEAEPSPLGACLSAVSGEMCAEALHDDRHEYNGNRHDAGNGDLSPRHLHFCGAWDRGGDQIYAFLIITTFALTPTVCTRGEVTCSLLMPLSDESPI